MPAAARYADVHLRQSQLGALRRDGKICPRHIAKAAAQAVSVHRADHRRPQLIQGKGAVIILLLCITDGALLNTSFEQMDVHTGRKGLTGGDQHRHPGVVLLIDVTAYLHQFLFKCFVDHIDRLMRHVDHRDMVVDLQHKARQRLSENMVYRHYTARLNIPNSFSAVRRSYPSSGNRARWDSADRS